MARTQSTAQAKGKGGKQWKPQPAEGETFAEVDLNAKKDDIQRHNLDTRNDDDLPGSEDDDRLGEETPSERRFLDRSKSVNKRIARLERKFNQQTADQEARYQRQLADLRRENQSLKVSKGVSDTDQAEHDRKIAALQKELEDAYEKGTTKEQAAITTRIAQLQGEFEAKKRAALLGAQEREPARDNRGNGRDDGGEPDNRGNGPTPQAKRWMRANDDWWTDPDFAIEKAAAVVIDNELIDEGSDPNDPEHYEELVERLLKKFPDMEEEIVMPGDRRSDRKRARDDDEDEDEGEDVRSSRRDTRRNGRPPVPAFNDRGADRGNRPRNNGRTVTLTREQRDNMVTFGLDPNNDDHVREYAKSAEETNRAYAREGRS